MSTTNLIELYGLGEVDEVQKAIKGDFIAYQGGDLTSFGGSKVVAFGTKGGVAVF
jgi:hypothetical protein